MAVKKTTLANGVRILTHRIPHARSVSLGVWVGVGARDESPAESGLSHFIEHMIFKGTARRSAFQIAKAFDVIGGQTNAFTAMEATCYHARVMDAHMRTMVEILLDIFLNSVFDPQEIERERAVIIQEVAMMEDSPEEYIHVLAERNFWGQNPLGQPIIGSRDNIYRFDADALKSFFRKCYHPESIVISAAGNLDHDRLLDIMGPALEKVKPFGELSPRSTPGGQSGVFVHARPLSQVQICVETSGISTTDPGRYGISLLNTLLGGNMSSRLFQEIRERRGLAYSVYSFVSSYTDTGLSGVYAGTTEENAPDTVALILEEMNRLKEVRVDDKNLQEAKEYTKGSLYLSAESIDNQMVRLAQNEIHIGRQLPVEEIIRNIEAVTPDEIQALAQRIYRSAPLALTLLGQVEDPGPFEKIISGF